MIRTDAIRALSDFRQNAKAHLERLEAEGGIEVLTVNGEARAVVMAPRVFDELAEKARLSEVTSLLLRGVADIDAGRVRDAKDALRELASKHGVDVDR